MEARGGGDWLLKCRVLGEARALGLRVSPKEHRASWPEPERIVMPMAFQGAISRPPRLGGWEWNSW
jgi:hypothetical protein